MSIAYVDSSVIVAMAFGEPVAPTCMARLRTFDAVLSSPLLEAEVRSAACRESVVVDPGLLSAIQWVHPTRGLGDELERILRLGYLRGAACWHLATALFVAPNPADLVFLTEDRRQREVAGMLGFGT